MAKEIGYFVDKGDDSNLYHPIRSRPDKRTDLEYYIETGRLPRKSGCCDLCFNLNKKEICNICTGWDNKFIVITLVEAQKRINKNDK